MLTGISVMYSQEIKNPASAAEFEELYQQNIKKTRINGVYIPKDLDDAIVELKALSPDSALDKFKLADEQVVAKKLHFGLGRWIYLYWNFEEGSRYVEYLRNLGLTTPDHMIEFTIVSLHRHLNGKEQEVQERIGVFTELRRKEIEKLNARRKVVTTQKVIGPIEKK